jgi:threonine dehydrogenase-like Zn-dependent dehydrogenase
MHQGVRFHLNPARIGLQRALPGRAAAFGVGALRLESLADPEPPPGWVAVEPVYSGICGSDVGVITGQASPYLAPLTGFPAVLGHEVAARRTDDGTPVAVDPSVACAARGLPPCRACARGDDAGCERRADPGLGAGMLLGFHARLPGGWATRMWVPSAQLYPLATSLPLRRAVLAEPLAIVRRGVSQVNLQNASRTLVIGAGTLGLLATWTLKNRGAGEVVVQARHAHQARVARKLGAAAVADDSPAFRAQLAGAVLQRPVFGAPPLHPWGPDLVVDTVGSARSVAEALTVARPGGQVLLIGAAHHPPADLSPLWTRNLTVVGTYGYRAQGVDHFAEAVQLLAGARELDALVTHAFPLERYREAVLSSHHHRGGAIKCVFRIGDPSD